ncbi:hypothetical protein B0H11DRAFT_2195955 [Mycena galericulata]|nr:hypothetical protein B0H11DRAFT_2195955 [Mycena galericulata]
MPQEIIDMVIDNVAHSPGEPRENKSTLATCALVCKSWVPRTRHHLFKHITLNKSIATFVPLLRSPYCTFTRSVRDIYAFRTFQHAPSEHHFDEIGKHLRRLVNLQSLMLDGMVNACNQRWNGFMCGFPNVTTLSLDCHLSGNSNCALAMVHSLPALRRLSANGISPVIFWDPRSLPPPPFMYILPYDLTPPPRLHSIETGGESARHILAWLHYFNRIGQIDTLELYTIPGADEGKIQKLLSLMGSTLHHLVLHSETGSNYSNHPSLLNTIDLSVFKKLKTLRVPSPSNESQDADAYEKHHKFILSISAPTLESIIIDHPGGGYELMNWAAIDAFFASPGFPRLHTVHIAKWSNESDFFQQNLPRLHQFGLLKVGRIGDDFF